ncbi:MAG TPA: Fic family protein [Roseiflexaceae bacterium]|nr:Fic family protein [Roseiflexaceae bacterium]HMP41751.1 Fic family protein [Roseiflexaceae bacterium]
MISYLTKDDLLDLHALAAIRYGGRLGIASQDRLTSVIDAPRQVLFDAELYPDLLSKAAALMFLLVKSRPFLWGNELTAILALLRFLDLNGHRLDPHVDDAQLVALVRSLHQPGAGREILEAWLRGHTVS